MKTKQLPEVIVGTTTGGSCKWCRRHTNEFRRIGGAEANRACSDYCAEKIVKYGDALERCTALDSKGDDPVPHCGCTAFCYGGRDHPGCVNNYERETCSI